MRTDLVVAGVVAVAAVAMLSAIQVRRPASVPVVGVEAVGPDACPYGAVRMGRDGAWTCITEGEADAIAEDCYRAAEDCKVESPETHARHEDGAPSCVLEDHEGWRSVLELERDGELDPALVWPERGEAGR